MTAGEVLGKRRRCTRCRRIRVVNAWWPDTRVALCKECSHVPNVAYNYSVRGTR
jgi:hypothetical protein